MTPDEPLPVAIANPTFVPPAIAQEAAALVAHWRAQRTARGALVLAYVAPIHVRRPPHAGNPPEGWTKCLIARHLLPELNGTWWIPNEIVAHVARFTGVSS